MPDQFILVPNHQMSFGNEVPGNLTVGEDCRIRLVKVNETGSVEIPGKGWGRKL
jgi:hypothetical protein